MIRTLTYAIMVIAAGPAFALSCVRPSVEQSYRNADASPHDHSIAVGQLHLLAAPGPVTEGRPRGQGFQVPTGYTVPARFDGEFFDGNGFTLSRDVSVTVNVTCVSMWCGAAQDVDYGLFFFRIQNGNYVLDANACPGTVFDDAHPGMLSAVARCHHGGC
ncbi:hypothetical protein [Hasllibacter sp. MH4015]|uniref:hypothetical protein n=1 Tax=Hasllibacter sp. MH4015 TaxID=2854029 RepID=UPI001CD7C760|nr:hypothetical protein [Hasllibacter sp. MH4015]